MNRKNNRYNSNRHSIFKLQFHLVVTTKFRHKVITQEINSRLKEIAYDIFENRWSCKIIEIETESDHIHIAFESTPQTQLSKLVNNFKTVSSRLVRKEFSQHISQYYWKPFFWSPSYLILSIGGATIPIIKEYISSQEVPKS
jgi:putative transposase